MIWSSSVLALLLLLLLIGGMAFREPLLRRLLADRLALLEERYQLEIRYDELSFSGLTTVAVEGLSVTPLERDTLLTLDSLEVSLRLSALIRGQVAPKRVSLAGIGVQVVERDSVSNLDFLKRKKTGKAGKDEKEEDTGKKAEAGQEAGSEQETAVEASLFSRSYNLLNRLFDLLPHDTRLHRLTFKAEQDSNYLRLDLPELSVGRRDSEKPDALCLMGRTRIRNLRLLHPRISPEVVQLDSGQLDFHLHVSPHFIELDSTSMVRFNEVHFHPYLRLDNRGSGRFQAAVNSDWFPARQLFNSLPRGLFTTLEGLRVKGDLKYHFLFDLDFDCPDSLQFVSRMQERGFAIDSFGRTDLRKMSGPFSYTAYDDGRPVRSFVVGPEYEHFTPLAEIPELLQMCVLQSEDGAFFYHQGFLPDALREALAFDIKARRFARGGSTISMQLVKNVFLNRNKNIARKLEEALVVWLIEGRHLTSKSRMWEVYLNIAEWGPMVYGIREAADYYFGKRPSELTLEESVFLSSIIPRPKHFYWSFNPDGTLRESQSGHFHLIARRLAAKGMITERQAEEIDLAKVVLTGPARERFRQQTDSIGGKL